MKMHYIFAVYFMKDCPIYPSVQKKYKKNFAKKISKKDRFVLFFCVFIILFKKMACYTTQNINIGQKTRVDTSFSSIAEGRQHGVWEVMCTSLLDKKEREDIVYENKKNNDAIALVLWFFNQI
jgi:hypothetical protein